MSEALFCDNVVPSEERLAKFEVNYPKIDV